MVQSNRNQSVEIQCKLIDWFLCDGNIVLNKLRYFCRLRNMLRFWDYMIFKHVPIAPNHYYAVLTSIISPTFNVNSSSPCATYSKATLAKYCFGCEWSAGWLTKSFWTTAYAPRITRKSYQKKYKENILRSLINTFFYYTQKTVWIHQLFKWISSERWQWPHKILLKIEKSNTQCWWCKLTH